MRKTCESLFGIIQFQTRKRKEKEKKETDTSTGEKVAKQSETRNTMMDMGVSFFFLLLDFRATQQNHLHSLDPAGMVLVLATESKHENSFDLLPFPRLVLTAYELREEWSQDDPASWPVLPATRRRHVDASHEVDANKRNEERLQAKEKQQQ